MNTQQKELIHEMSMQQNQQYVTALGGFFSWLGRTIRNVTNAVAQVSHNPFFIINILEDAFNGGGFSVGYCGKTIDIGGSPIVNTGCRSGNVPFEDVPLTPQDEAKLDLWVNTKFLPFFKTYFATIKNFNTKGTNLRNFIDHYNKAQEFISLLEWYQPYVLTHSEAGFSNNALRARNQFLSIQINVLQAEISSYMESTSMAVVPQRTNTAYNTNKYSVLGFNLPNTITTSQLTLLNPSIADGNEILPTVDSQPAPTTASGKSSGAALVFWTLLAVGLYHLVKEKEDDTEGERVKPKKEKA